MRALFRLAIIVLAAISSTAWAETIEITISKNDIFRIPETNQWDVKLERYQQFQFADVWVNDKHGYPSNLMLNFKADTSQQAQFNSRKKMAQAVRANSEKYLPGMVEKTVTLQKVPIRSTYGFYTVLTDAAMANKAKPEPGDMKYLTKGMIRLSKNSVLEFTLKTKDIESFHYRKMLNYVYSFVKPGRK